MTLTSALAAGTVAALVGTAGASQTASTHRATTATAPHTVLLGETAVPTTLDTYGRSHDASVYGGSVVTDSETHVDVYLTTLTAAAERPYLAMAPAGSISFLHTANSVATLTLVDDAVTAAAIPTVTEKDHIRLIWWGGDVYNGTIDLAVENVTPAQRVTLAGLFGASRITVEDLTASEVPRPATYNRTSDASPFFGGDSVGVSRPAEDSGCTTGFTGTKSGTKVIITAAHCFWMGESASMDILTTSGLGGSGNTVGKVIDQSQSAHDTDTELLGATGAPTVWAGPIGSPIAQNVSGFTNNPVGDDVCVDGSYDGENGSNNGPASCGSRTGSYFVTITDNGDGLANGICNTDGEYAVSTEKGTAYPVTHDLYENLVETCHDIVASAPAGDVAVGEGDSGGPVFRFTSSGLEAVGIVSAGSSEVSCVENTLPGRECFSTIYYSAIDSVLGQWGVSLDTAP